MIALPSRAALRNGGFSQSSLAKHIRAHSARAFGGRISQIELRTWQALVVYRSKVLAKELGGQGKELGDAEDYLVRWERDCPGA